MPAAKVTTVAPRQARVRGAFRLLSALLVLLAARAGAAEGDVPGSEPGEPLTLDQYEVVIAGGSTAALAAALTSAERGAATALIEPTDWIGGQLTASGVPAVDEAWHQIRNPRTRETVLDVATVARDPRNMTPKLFNMLSTTGCPGRCWVSRFCFQPREFLKYQLEPAAAKLGYRLKIYPNTVIKNVEVDEEAGRVVAITAVRRFPKPDVPNNGYDRHLSADLADWYDPRPSDRFDKRVLRFTAAPGESRFVVIEATEWGEVLALCGARYMVGVDDYDGATTGDDTNGQATVFGVVQEYHAEPQEEAVPDLGVEHLGFGPYARYPDAWNRIWTYRRLKARFDSPRPGDLSLQNWSYANNLGQGGNDYPFGYLLLSKEETEKQRADWRGGVDVEVIRAAEKRALAWHYWLKANVPEGIMPEQITIAPSVLGTAHGLSKVPYVRDTRRSIGLDGFVLRLGDMTGSTTQVTGTKFADRVAIGAYASDIHPLAEREYPAYISEDYETLPFYIPFRALTHHKYGNLLVAGKTMSQSFLANSATRLHPIEWSTGTAAGAAAALMVEWEWDTRQVLDHISGLQAALKELTPIEWTID